MAIITTTQLSKISNYRLDAQYYDPIQLKNDNNLKKCQNKALLHLANVNGGKRLPKGEPFSENGFPYLRVVDIQNSFIDDSKAAFISERVWKVISKYDIKLDDVLVTIVGNTVGLTGLLNKDLGIANFTENCARIRNSKIDPYYILAFLISKFGQNQVEREKVGTSQPKLSLDRLRRFRIFIPEEIELEHIANLVKKSSSNRLQSQTLYKQATNLLEQELGLDKISYEKPKSCRSTNSNVIISKRADAEFYNPELKNYYDYFQNVIGKELAPITQYARVIKYGNPDYAETGIPIITQKHLSDITPEGYTGFPIASISWVAKYPSAVLRENDLLFYSVGAYLGKTNIWFNKDKAVHASFITMLRCENYYDAGYLMVLLNSKYGILQSKVFQSGSSQPYIYPKDIRQFLIPNIDIDLRIKLFNLMKESYEAKKQSQQLLADAKARVEQLIEEAANN